MNNKKIEVGDVVDVYFTSSSALFRVTVQYKPCATGDSWILENINAPEGFSRIHYVNMFERMDLIIKGEQVQ